MSGKTKANARSKPIKAAPLAPPSANADHTRPMALATICVFLAMATWLVFSQTLHHEFINFDDDKYVYNNPPVTGGLTHDGITWAFTHTHASNWHPLTWLSHMLDWQIYGPQAGGHHLTNVLLHAVVAMLLFLVLEQMTGARWRSAFVAALFAIHPLRVESVAWVAERKDVLSGVFFMLTLGAYVLYVQGGRSWGRYLLVSFFLACGLMAKPTLVMVPFLLLLLDYWPLNRMPRVAGQSGFSIPLRLILEKVPLFALAAGSCAITLFAQQDSIDSTLAFPWRAGNALTAYVQYLGQMLYPANLASLYPHPRQHLPLWQPALALVTLSAITLGAFRLRRNRPWLLVGWLWYLAVLLPMIGIIQSGSQAHADRHTYLAQIGLYLLLTWTITEWSAPFRYRRHATVAAGGAAIVLLMICAHRQTAYWRNSESLWTRTISVTSGNGIAHNNLGLALVQMGRVDQAIAEWQKAIEINPDQAEAYNNLGNALRSTRPITEVIAHYEKALAINPDYTDAHANLANALAGIGRVKEAIAHWQTAIDEDPHAMMARDRLAWVLATCPDGSIRNGARALAIAEESARFTGGKDPMVLDTLAAAHAETGEFNEAIQTAYRAQELATAQGNQNLMAALRTEIRAYQSGRPLRDRTQPITPAP